MLTLDISDKCLKLNGVFFLLLLFCPCPSCGISGVSSGNSGGVIKNQEPQHEIPVLLCHRVKVNYISGVTIIENFNAPLPYSWGRM